MNILLLPTAVLPAASGRKPAGPRRATEAGFTLVEMILSLGLGLLVVTLMVAMYIYASRNFLSLATYADMDRSDRLVLDQLTTEFRQATNVLAWTSNSLALAKLDGTVVRYSLDTQARAVVRKVERTTVSGTTLLTTNTATIEQQNVLEYCDNLVFSLYKATPGTNGAMDLASTTDLPYCKALKVEWKCARNPYPYKTLTETFTSGTIVMRMQDFDY